MRYLKARWSALILRYGVVYVAMTLAAVFAKHSSVLLPFSIGFWIIFGTLILIENLGSYTVFSESGIVQRYFFFRYAIPITDIISLKKGYAESITGTPEAVLMKFKRKDGSDGTYYIFPDQYAQQDIKAFAAELAIRNKKIEIDPDLLTS
jgi:hypothetical protein